MDVANCIHYDRAIFQYEISCCVGSAKKINWLNFGRKKIGTIHALRSGFLLFLQRTQYKVFRNKILYNHSACSCLQLFFF
jgi:hypothetical protein